jgi:hypothetical protein
MMTTTTNNDVWKPGHEIIILFNCTLVERGPDSSVVTATGYGLDGPGIESR